MCGKKWLVPRYDILLEIKMWWVFVRNEIDLTRLLSLQLVYQIKMDYICFDFTFLMKKINLLIMYVAVDHFRVSQFNRLEVYVFNSRIAHQFIQVRPWLKLFCFCLSAGFFKKYSVDFVVCMRTANVCLCKERTTKEKYSKQW